MARAAIEGMLCGLADGFAVLRSHGVEAKRVLLVGGAAANPAVQLAASQIFGVDVEIPKLGEYVADGAARQASHSLTGAAPAWPVEMQARVAADHRPEILHQYHAAQTSIYKI